MSTVAIVNSGLSNLDSIARAIAECGGTPVVTTAERDIATASHIILPGQGAFGDGMASLTRHGLDTILHEHVVTRGVPFLGICLGMQLLAERGFESGETPGLGWIRGEVRKLAPSPEERLPHVGWNEVHYQEGAHAALFAGIAAGTDFYFVHSFHIVCADSHDVVAHTPYGGGFVSALRHGNIFGVQFHPEKSQKVGFQLLRNFLAA